MRVRIFRHHIYLTSASSTDKTHHKSQFSLGIRASVQGQLVGEALRATKPQEKSAEANEDEAGTKAPVFCLCNTEDCNITTIQYSSGDEHQCYRCDAASSFRTLLQSRTSPSHEVDAFAGRGCSVLLLGGPPVCAKIAELDTVLLIQIEKGNKKVELPE